jgi:glucosamine--fructose-6-phosphate aminotransferase (isomerizing)
MMLWENKLAQNQLTSLGDVYKESFPEIDARLRNLFTAGELMSVKKVYVVGDGDSYHAGIASSGAFLNLTDVEYYAVPAMRFLACEVEYMRDYSPGQSMVIGVSASGESRRVVQCLIRAREKMPDARIAALVGNPESSVARAAGAVLNVRLPNPELGMAPGIRTYLASLFGLAALAIRLGELQNRYHMTEANTLRRNIAGLGEHIPGMVEAASAEASRIRQYAAAPFFMTAGSGSHRGTAVFAAAKLTEIAGIYCVPRDLEEWMHVEQFSYPVNTPLIVFAPQGASFNHALGLMETARRIGHPIIAVTNEPENERIKALSSSVFPVPGKIEEDFLHLLFFVPPVSMGVALSGELGRAMFMTDNEAIQKQRAAMTQNLKEDV